jgi:hypothetical protein
MALKFMPLNKVSMMMQEVGFEPGYAYDDLVFSNDAVFLIQFDLVDKNKLLLYFNEDCEQNTARKLEIGLIKAAAKQDFNLVMSGSFSIFQEDGSEEITIRFVSLVED